MPTQDIYWMFSAAGFAVAMSATPGPNNAMVAASGANFGIVRTLPHIFGISVGFPVMLAAVALGAGGLVQSQPGVFAALHWLGAGYLVWLAWRVAMAQPAQLPVADAAAPVPTARARPLRFIEAALFQWVNPKAWLIALSGVAAYATEGGRVAPAQVLVLAALFLVICIPATALWTGIGAGVARLLRTPRQLRLFNAAMAALLLASLVPLLRE